MFVALRIPPGRSQMDILSSFEGATSSKGALEIVAGFRPPLGKFRHVTSRLQSQRFSINCQQIALILKHYFQYDGKRSWYGGCGYRLSISVRRGACVCIGFQYSKCHVPWRRFRCRNHLHQWSIMALRSCWTELGIRWFPPCTLRWTFIKAFILPVICHRRNRQCRPSSHCV